MEMIEKIVNGIHLIGNFKFYNLFIEGNITKIFPILNKEVG